jgi:rod shape-determining protein MreD
MTFLRGLLAAAIALGAEALIGRVVPAALGYLDLMLVVVVYFAIRHSQRSAMLVGCAGGLLHDAWFQAGVFGMGGFKKTLLAWIVGGLASRLDLNHAPGRMAVGMLVSVADQFLESGLFRLMDLETAPLDPVTIVGRAASTGVLVAVVFAIVDRRGSRASMRGIRRRA